MKGTFIQNGDVIEITASANIAYGDVVAVGTKIGVAVADVASGAKGNLSFTGVYEMPTAAEAIAVGDKLYFDSANSCVTKTAGSLTVIAGIAVTAKSGSTAGKVYVRIN